MGQKKVFILVRCCVLREGFQENRVVREGEREGESKSGSRCAKMEFLAKLLNHLIHLKGFNFTLTPFQLSEIIRPLNVANKTSAHCTRRWHRRSHFLCQPARVCLAHAILVG